MFAIEIKTTDWEKWNKQWGEKEGKMKNLHQK